MGGNKYCSGLKSRILADFDSGLRQNQLFRKYSVHISTISRIIKFRNVNINHRGGRPRKTTVREDRQIINLLKKNKQMSSREVKVSLELNLDTSTIRRRAMQTGLRSYKVVKKPYISKKKG